MARCRTRPPPRHPWPEPFAARSPWPSWSRASRSPAPPRLGPRRPRGPSTWAKSRGSSTRPGPPFDLATGASAETQAGRDDQTRVLASLGAGAGVPASAVRAAVASALPAQPALDAGAVADVAPDIPTLLRHLDGRVVRVRGASVTLATASTADRPVD